MYDYSYGFNNDINILPDYGTIASGVGAAVAGILAIVLFFYGIILAFGIVSYIFRALSVHSIAKRRNIDHPWLAWIPVGSAWTLGCISDQYQYVARGKVKNRRKILLGLMIAMLAISFPVGIISAVVSALVIADASAAVFTVLTVLLTLGILAAGIAYEVFYYMSLYDLYRSCEPSDATLFLVLSILFQVAEPFIIFACRKKDLGMPERKPAPVVQQMEASAEEIPVQEMDENEATEEDFVEE